MAGRSAFHDPPPASAFRHAAVRPRPVPTGILRRPYRFYLHKVLPKLAGAITGSKDAYEYLGGWNVVAVVAFVLAIVPLVPGFLASLGVANPPAFFIELYKWSWFVAFVVAGGTYLLGMKLMSAVRAQGLSRVPQ